MRTTIMLYLGIDQHARQITISLGNGKGDVILARQVSTRWEKINVFFQHLTRECLSHGESFIAVVEVCGFNDWLIRMLRDYRCHYRCHKVILIQPDVRKHPQAAPEDAFSTRRRWLNGYMAHSRTSPASGEYVLSVDEEE
ncbi:MAG: hypothetical protein ACR2NU_14725 [Aeoliella sp.]